MTDESERLERRSFLKGAAVAGAAVATFQTPAPTMAQAPQAASAAAGAAAGDPHAAALPGYQFLKPEEAAFVEAVADAMIPADKFTPSGTEVGIPAYIDRQLAGGWGKGDRLYSQGPWKTGTPSQGYQLPLTPAQLYRAGIEATNAHCVKTYGKTFDRLSDAQKEEVLQGLDRGQIKFASGLPSGVFFGHVYANVMEGLFADPIYGGNRDKVGWKLVGFPGVLASYREKFDEYKNKAYVVEPTSIADLS